LEQINATLLYYWKMKQDVTAVGASIVSFVTGLADAVDHGDLELDPVQREIDSAQSLFERETAPERLLAGDLTSGLASAAGSAGPGQEIQVPTRLVRLKGQDLQASGGLLQTAKDLADTLALDARVFSDKGQAAYRAYEASRLRLWRKFGTGAPFHNILGAGYIKYADVHDSIDIDTAMKIGGR
jgi:hypothetical protein